MANRRYALPGNSQGALPLSSSSLSRPGKVVLALFFCLALASLVRAQLGAINGSGDFATIYLASTAWVRGVDPYDHRHFPQFWQEAGGPRERLPSAQKTPSVYPLTALTLVAPLTFLKWGPARSLWLLLNCLALVGLLMALLALGQISLGEWRAWLLITAAISQFPVKASIVMGQPVILVVGFAALSLWVFAVGRPVLSGVLIGLAACLKPQVALPFLIYHGVRRRWAVLGVALGVMAAIFGLGIFHLGLDSFDWVRSWQENLEAPVNSGSMDNPVRFHLINLHYLLHTFSDSKGMVNALVLALVAGQMAFWLWALPRGETIFGELLTLSAIVVIILLASYHRGYDGVLLIFPATLAILMINPAQAKYSLTVWVLYAAFLNNSQTWVGEFSRQGLIPPVLTNTWWWQKIIMTHQVWALLLLSFLLLYLMVVQKKIDRGISTEEVRAADSPSRT